MEIRAEGILQPDFGQFRHPPFLPADGVPASDAGQEQDDLRWRRIGFLLCFCSGAITISLAAGAYQVLFG